LLFSNFTIQSNGNQLFLLIGSSSGQLSNCFYDFLSEIIMTPEVNLYSSIFIDTDLLYQFPKVFWAVLIQKLNSPLPFRVASFLWNCYADALCRFGAKIGSKTVLISASRSSSSAVALLMMVYSADS